MANYEMTCIGVAQEIQVTIKPPITEERLLEIGSLLCVKQQDCVGMEIISGDYALDPEGKDEEFTEFIITHTPAEAFYDVVADLLDIMNPYDGGREHSISVHTENDRSVN